MTAALHRISWLTSSRRSHAARTIPARPNRGLEPTAGTASAHWRELGKNPRPSTSATQPGRARGSAASKRSPHGSWQSTRKMHGWCKRPKTWRRPAAARNANGAKRLRIVRFTRQSRRLPAQHATSCRPASALMPPIANAEPQSQNYRQHATPWNATPLTFNCRAHSTTCRPCRRHWTGSPMPISK